MYKTEDFDFGVPRELIAQEPIEPRDSSRLLVLHRDSGSIEHTHFYNLPSYLEPGDVLVFNDSRVIPARLRGNKEKSPMEEVKIVLLRNFYYTTWQALVEEGEVETGDVIVFSPPEFTGFIDEVGEKVGKRLERVCTIDLSDNRYLDTTGEMPIPPYIHSLPKDKERYQTVYSKIRGSAAAPTAGLHFTDRLMEELINKGVYLAFVTLHVGLDTFMPVLEEDPRDHKMYTEFCQISKETADLINKQRWSGHKIVGVGTTSVRTLESAYYKDSLGDGGEEAYADWTGLYILPGTKVRSIDAMVTNLHYPRSSNLMMVCAIAGYDNVKEAYKEAIEQKYRAYSFGDSMLIL